MRRLPHRLKPRIPAGLALLGPVLVAALYAGLLIALAGAELLPHQKKLTMAVLSVFTLVLVVALARPLATALFARGTLVEVDRLPPRAGDRLRVHARQEGAGLRSLDVRLQGLRDLARGNEELVVDLPVGAAAARGFQASVDAEVVVPDAPRWRIRVVAAFDAASELVRDFPLKAV